MPNIVEYTSKSEIHPSDKGIQAAEAAASLYARVGNQIGRDIGGALNKIGDVVERHDAIMETSELYKTGTELENNVEKRWVEWSSDPENRNNPHAADIFLAAEVTPLLDQWGEGARTDHGKQLAASLKASIRNKLFNKITADQAEMSAAHADDNLTQTINNLATSVITDPSEANLRRTLGTADAAIQGITGTIPDVGMRERAATDFNHKAASSIVMARYITGVGNSIKNQIAETGGETSPATEQLDKDIENKLGFEFLSPEQQTRIMSLKEQAVSQGQELYNSRNATIKSKAKEEGQAAYAELHSEATSYALTGTPPPPDFVAKTQEFARRYGSILPGEVASMDSYVISQQDRAIGNKVQPFNQNVRDNIQAGFSLPKGDPRRPTLASLTKQYSAGQITPDDFKEYTEILNKLDKPSDDPSFGPAWQQFQRWQNTIVQSIGTDGGKGTAAARAAFIHDSTNNFMARGRATGNWEGTLDRVTDPRSRGSFAAVIEAYRMAAKQRSNADEWLKGNWPKWNPDGSLTWPAGHGGSRPAAPGRAVAPAAPAPAQSPAEDLQKADEFLWGKK